MPDFAAAAQRAGAAQTHGPFSVKPVVIWLAAALFGIQAGFHGFTASLPVALARAGHADAEIGLIVGVASLIQVPAAIGAGALLDRFGGSAMLCVAALAYFAGAVVLVLFGGESGTNLAPVLVARLFQGLGVAAALPSALSLVPRLVPRAGLGAGLAFVGSSYNLTLAVLPPLSLLILDRSSLRGVALFAGGFVLVGLVLAFVRARTPGIASGTGRDALPKASRRFGFAFRRSWTGPLAIVVLYVAHWGVITAFLPQRAMRAGVDVSPFFVADGLAVLGLRLAAGYLVDRIRGVFLTVAGIVATAIGIMILAGPPNIETLLASGVLTGSGASFVLAPLVAQLSARSGEGDRGSAFALLSGAMALAVFFGSVGAAPVIALAGFEVTILATLLGLAVAAWIALHDPGLWAPLSSIDGRPVDGNPQPTP